MLIEFPARSPRWAWRLTAVFPAKEQAGVGAVSTPSFSLDEQTSGEACTVLPSMFTFERSCN